MPGTVRFTAVVRISKLALVVLLLTLTACGSEPAPAVHGPAPAVHPPPPPQGPELRLLFIGASMTAGYYASNQDHAYPELVAHELESQGWRVHLHVLARGGTTVRLADRWDLDAPSDVAVVQLATNDYGRSIPLTKFEKGYALVLDRVRDTSPNTQLLCLGGWDDPRRMNRLGVAAAQYDAAAAAACTAARGQYVGLSALYLDSRDHGPRGRDTFLGRADRFHPNDRGHELIADAVLHGLRLSPTGQSTSGLT